KFPKRPETGTRRDATTRAPLVPKVCPVPTIYSGTGQSGQGAVGPLQYLFFLLSFSETCPMIFETPYVATVANKQTQALIYHRLPAASIQKWSSMPSHDGKAFRMATPYDN